MKEASLQHTELLEHADELQNAIGPALATDRRLTAPEISKGLRPLDSQVHTSEPNCFWAFIQTAT